ncbi:MAG: NAD+ synthase [Candidatus Krumholzibacteriota bacterium]
MNMEPERPDWAVAPQEAAARCAEFIRETMRAAGRDSLVVGLSGGIDSAVAAGLAVQALGADKVLGVMMPYATSSAASLTDAAAVASVLDMKTEKVEITPMADAFLAGIPAPEQVRRGNVMARCRMIVLYDVSARDGSLVLGTGNRTEALLGYTTLFGDNACALNPVGRLYKTEIRLLADHLGLPRAVLAKAPSADLWEGQADEDELGYTYAEVDRLLVHMIDQGLGPKQLETLGFAPDLIDRVAGRVRAMAFKRAAPPVAEFPGRVHPDELEAGRPEAEPPGEAFTDGGFH